MVKKLFKHEIRAYLRVMPLVYIIVLAMSVFGRVIQFFENDGLVYNIVSGFAFLTYGVSIFAALFFTKIFAVVRFYKNLFTTEGYLTFTLPVTPTQHIIVKVLTAVFFDVITFVTLLASGCIITLGELLVEIFKAVGYILNELFKFVGFHSIAYALELIAIMLLAGISGYLLYYTFISIGQLFKKNRILAAFGAYFVYYLATQAISTVFTILTALFGDKLPWQQITEAIIAHPYATVHIVLCFTILLSAAFSLLYFVIIKLIIRKKLNLE